MSDSRAVDVASWTDGEASSTVDALHEDESAGNKKRRHQGKQACQQCRRRKIKCDETRPKCKSCGKAKLPCQYELPAGQTRQQALVENQSKIQHELEAHASLISTLRTLPTDAANEVLSRLREGQYDGILVGRPASLDGTEVQQISYPWEYPIDNAEDDASGEEEEEEACSDNAASLPHSYTQSVGQSMELSSSQQSRQMSNMPFAAMPQMDPSLPYPGYYAPYMAYQNPAVGQQTFEMGMPSEQLHQGQMNMSQQATQQFHMGPPVEDNRSLTDQRPKRAPHR
ncbi:hypothetical protein B0A48_04845 [Cryoendolithus antarcticus]|uniref:Zn(2)-C6 fungal-type domain-containing protein n=1 Tax=Cryoendolithus antarcticus TaxID=1507870 RepID=A0A1V8TDJ4_9PEZI|nr:hypothetical protein B0A48_04845 [Cryoendolithus antarcticus]